MEKKELRIENMVHFILKHDISRITYIDKYSECIGGETCGSIIDSEIKIFTENSISESDVFLLQV
jgi:hypothetical protein